MPKPIARSKTKKAVAKRFKVTAKGKVVTSRAGRRHLAGTKNRKRMRSLGKPKTLDTSDLRRVIDNLPFSH
jgi:large subunit ribosomal protein L35